MPKVSSYLKGLAERRARFDADALRLGSLHEEIGLALADAIRHRDSCDVLIKHHTPSLDPKEIAPIRSWKGHYGKRGQLKESVGRILRERYPAEVSTTELCFVLEAEFKLNFTSKVARRYWTHNSLNNAVKQLVNDGKIERMHDVKRPFGEVGRWRWHSEESSSLDHLRAQVEALGITIQQCDDDHE